MESLAAGEVFPEYTCWDELGSDVTRFEEGVKNMLWCAIKRKSQHLYEAEKKSCGVLKRSSINSGNYPCIY